MSRTSSNQIQIPWHLSPILWNHLAFEPSLRALISHAEARPLWVNRGSFAVRFDAGIDVVTRPDAVHSSLPPWFSAAQTAHSSAVPLYSWLWAYWANIFQRAWWHKGNKWSQACRTYEDRRLYRMPQMFTHVVFKLLFGCRAKFDNELQKVSSANGLMIIQ